MAGKRDTAAGDTKVDAIVHDEETRAHIPPVELESVVLPQDAAPIKVAVERRNPDLDPQLVWRGKDTSDWSDLVVDAPPIYLQEQIHPKALIEDLRAWRRGERDDAGPTLFEHFGLTDKDSEAEIEFYRHTKRWSNRMILGDSLAVMASLAEREGLRGKVQCIYIDPPYGIRFNSNFQWSTTSRDVKDGKLDHLTREPEQVKAFRDTWRDGIHSYLTYLRDRLTVARDLLADSGSVFVQIGDENVHRVRALMDEVFGERNFCADIIYQKTLHATSTVLPTVHDYVIWYAKEKLSVKYRPLNRILQADEIEGAFRYFYVDSLSGPKGGVRTGASYPAEQLGRFMSDNITSAGGSSYDDRFTYEGVTFSPGKNLHWKTNIAGMSVLTKAGRIFRAANSLRYCKLPTDATALPSKNIWTDTTVGSFAEPKAYIVQTTAKVVERCILMTTDPGDLVLDPTCGSGTTATVAEQWGRRWITIDTSRVALALARSRIMGARYPYYLLADSPKGVAKEAAITRTPPATHKTHGDIRLGFVYERVPHITLKSIANNAEIDVIWERLQPAVEAARNALNDALAGHTTPSKVTTGGRAGQEIDFTASGTTKMPSGEEAPANGFCEWEIPREAPDDWPDPARAALQEFWTARIKRQREIDASIAAKADSETLYDKPYEDKRRVRVAGPFTVEALSPHNAVSVGEDDLGDVLDASDGRRRREAIEADNYFQAMLENLRHAGVHQRDRADRITFQSLKPWAGEYISAEGIYLEGDGEDGGEEIERRAAIFIGPEYGTVTRADLVAAAREAHESRFDILIACAFNFDARASELGPRGVPILRARMNAELHVADAYKSGGGNLFVVFGEPDIAVQEDGDKLTVTLQKLYTFRPSTGAVEATDADDIACWFIDTDYNEESFFVRHAYFPAADVPYKALKTTLKADIDEEAWETLKRTTSRPFARPTSGRIAVKVINHLGDEVMKVLRV